MKTNSKFEYLTNEHPKGPCIVDNEIEEIVYKPEDDSPELIKNWLTEHGISDVAFDADGNGSIVNIPVYWINDGEKLKLSKRVLSLV